MDKLKSTTLYVKFHAEQFFCSVKMRNTNPRVAQCVSVDHLNLSVIRDPLYEGGDSSFSHQGSDLEQDSSLSYQNNESCCFSASRFDEKDDEDISYLTSSIF